MARNCKAMSATNLKLLKAPPSSSERIPVNFFDPLARKQSELRVAMLLVDCLNSYIKSPLFPDKLVARRTL